MRSFCIKGVRIGEGRPKTIVPLMDATCEGLLASARQAVEAGADCVEWRADFFEDSHDGAALGRVARVLGDALPRTPLIATLRTTGQGGRLEANADEYASLVRALLQGTDLVDVELGAGEQMVRSLAEEARSHGVRTVVSHHEFEVAPSVTRMEQTLLAEAELGADIPKLAVMAHGAADAARLMEASANAADTFGGPLLTMAMGPAGAITRLAGESFGSALTFCALGAASAPGQVELAQATAALDALHAALADGGCSE